MPARGSHDRALVHSILDEALVCHLGFLADVGPLVVPTVFVRDGEVLYVHGAAAGRMLRTLAQGVSVCVAVTLVDGLVLARSAFHHSMNYRSVLVFGRARDVAEPEQNLHAMERLIDKVSPGRWGQIRAPSEKELRATSVLALPIVEASAKVRSGGPMDDKDDLALPVWAGVVPLRLCAEAAVSDAEGAAHPPPEILTALLPPSH